ncbi:MAG: acetyl esterase [Verrucomicrobiales bacterium]|jgi:acetyl esterase
MQLESVIEEPDRARARAIGIVDRNRRLLDHASQHSYKFDPESERALGVHVFVPQDWSVDDQRTAILFFHSSQWDHGNITQFAPHAMFFASRGAVCILVEYRMGASSGKAPLQAMADARSAIRWARINRRELGIDEQKIVASGGSCGAHAAIAAAMCGEEFDESSDDADTPCAPDACIFFSPVLDISKRGFGFDSFPDTKTASRSNPLKCIRSGLPPMILFHGSADASVPLRGAQKFAKKMRRKKNACELVEFGGASHSFFNFNVNDENYYATVDSADSFLVELGFIEPRNDFDC